MTAKVRLKFHIVSGRTGHKAVEPGPESPKPPAGRIPRISRLMALAIRFEHLIRDGVVKDQAELARLALVSRARVTQIMDLLMLAPEIQESLLFLPAVEQGDDPVHERQVRRIVAQASWERQIEMWTLLKRPSTYNRCEAGSRPT